MRLFILFVSLIFLAACTDKPKEQKFYNIFDPLVNFDDVPPIIHVNVSPDSGNANETVFKFDASDSRENEYENVNLLYQWDMDNNSNWDSTATIDPVKYYKFPTGGGDKWIKLRVIGAKNLYRDTSLTVFINAPPVIILHWIQEGNFFRFDASDSYDLEDGKHLDYRWDFDSNGSWDVDWDTSTVAEYNFDSDDWNLIVEARDKNKAVTSKEYNKLLGLNPVAVYLFSGNANDESGNGNNGTVYGATLTEDRFGNPNSAYLFDGIDDYIDYGNKPDLKPKFPLTIAAWVNILSFSNNIGIFRSCIADSNYFGFMFLIANSHLQLGFGNGGIIEPSNRTVLINDNVLEINKWYHFVGIIINRDSIHLYINGEEVSGEISGSAIEIIYNQNSAQSATIDNWLNSPEQYANVILDDIYLFNRALTSDEILYLYNGNTIY